MPTSEFRKGLTPRRQDAKTEHSKPSKKCFRIATLCASASLREALFNSGRRSERLHSPHPSSSASTVRRHDATTSSAGPSSRFSRRSLPFGVYYRARSATREKLDRWQEGALILFGLRLGAVPMAVGFIAWIINPRWMAWAKLPLPIWLRFVGLAVFLLGDALLVWTFRNLGSNLTDTVVTRRDHTLVTTGPYRFVRHPFYLAFALAVLGLSLAAANWFLFVAGCIPLAFIAFRTPIEEAKLIDRFGDEYRRLHGEEHRGSCRGCGRVGFAQRSRSRLRSSTSKQRSRRPSSINLRSRIPPTRQILTVDRGSVGRNRRVIPVLRSEILPTIAPMTGKTQPRMIAPTWAEFGQSRGPIPPTRGSMQRPDRARKNASETSRRSVGS